MIKGVKTKISCETTKLAEVVAQGVSLERDFELEELQLMENSSPIPKDEYLTIDQVAAYLHINRVTIWRYRKQGLLKPRRIGNRILFARADIDNYLMKDEDHGEH